MYKSSSVKFDIAKASNYYDLIKTIKKVFDYINVNIHPSNYTNFDLDRDYAEIKELCKKNRWLNCILILWLNGILKKMEKPNFQIF